MNGCGKSRAFPSGGSLVWSDTTRSAPLPVSVAVDQRSGSDRVFALRAALPGPGCWAVSLSGCGCPVNGGHPVRHLRKDEGLHVQHILKRSVLVAATATGMLTGVGASAAHADAGAQGASAGSPGVIAGGVLQAPVHVPVNLCGNTVDVIGLLNPAFGNTCANPGGHHPSSGHKPPGHRPPGHKPPGHKPPGHQPPGHKPPGHQPPGSHKPPGHQPPGHKPPGHQPPGHQPPGHQPPGHKPPGHQPPGSHQPPGHQPPGHKPPGHRPPAHETPGTPGPGGHRPPSDPRLPGQRPPAEVAGAVDSRPVPVADHHQPSSAAAPAGGKGWQVDHSVQDAQRPALAHTGSSQAGATAATGAALLLGGVVLFRRGRASRA